MNRTYKKILVILVFFAFASLPFSCGRDGNSDNVDSSSGGDNKHRGPLSSTTNSLVEGSVALSNTSIESVGLQIWFLNHSESTFFSVPITSDGTFSISIKKFLEGSVYTTHLMTNDFREIGMIDVSTVLDGIQGAYIYRGGIGFNFGEIAINLDKNGHLKPSFPITGRIGGGFSVEPNTILDMNSFRFPDYVDSLTVSGSLIIANASILLNSFYLREQNSEAFARDLEKYTAISANVVLSEPGSLDRVSVFRAGNWLESSRITANFSDGVESSHLWNLDSYNFSKDSETGFSAQVYTGRIVSADSAVLVALVPKIGTQQFVGPRVLRTVFTMPPKVEGISLDGAAPLSLDYTDTSIENGLTKPFCMGSHDPLLDILAPQDENGMYIANDTLDSIKLKFNYYDLKSGLLEKIEVTAADYSAPYNSDSSDTEISDISRHWKVALQELQFVMGSNSGATNKKSITIPKELFLESSHGKKISKIKIIIYFEDSNHSDVSGSVVWFDTDC